MRLSKWTAFMQRWPLSCIAFLVLAVVSFVRLTELKPEHGCHHPPAAAKPAEGFWVVSFQEEGMCAECGSLHVLIRATLADGSNPEALRPGTRFAIGTRLIVIDQLRWEGQQHRTFVIYGHVLERDPPSIAMRGVADRRSSPPVQGLRLRRHPVSLCSNGRIRSPAQI